MERSIKMQRKFRMKILSFCGDYYYEEMSEQETLDKAYAWWGGTENELKNHHEIDCWA